VANLIIPLLIVLSFNFSTTTQNIEKAFLQNNPKILYNLLSTRSHINISLPEPIFFSDQLSNHQTFFLFKKIFDSYETFEFYSDQQPFIPEENTLILKARWSFRDKKNNDQFLFHVFFYLISEKAEKIWKITEIKAEKI